MADTLRISVLISSYNYLNYIEETIQSVLCQTRPADEVIIVDDGSQDGSYEFIKFKYSDHDNMIVIGKNNGGQMSALNEAFRNTSGDIVCFLDSDDQYEVNYLEELEKVYLDNPKIQYVTCAYREFGNRSAIVSRYSKSADLGITPLGVYYGNIWTSGPTATISVRYNTLKKYFPVPFEQEWIISPDVCLTTGASMVGARKYFLATPLIRYRIHDNNAHIVNSCERYSNLFKRYQFMNYVLKVNDIKIDSMLYYICDEFNSIKNTDVKHAVLFKYLKIIMRSKETIQWKISAVISIAIRYFINGNVVKA